MLRLIAVGTTSVNVVMARPAQPKQVPGFVAAALRTEDDVVRIGAGTALAAFAGFPEVLEPEPAQGFGVLDTGFGARVRTH